MRENQSTRAVFHKALQKAQESNAARINLIRLALGEIAELDKDAIQRHWDELSKGTLLEYAAVHFRSIHAEAQCMACFKKYHPADGKIHCPHCGSFGAKILSGEEFHFESIETEE
ncbi:MAG TPA: hypothetical protein DCX53_16610 [Anaerolineae bacterium]|nr:hypothetical protein [Anaerolineae bacterium]